MSARRVAALLLVLTAAGAAAWWFFLRDDAGPHADSPGDRAAREVATGPVLEAPAATGKPRVDPKAGMPDGRPDGEASSAATPTAQHPASLRVVVLGARKAPLEAARVTVAERTVATDADGVARFAGLALPRVTVQVSAAGHLPPDTAPLAALVAGVETETKVELEPGRALEGRVIDARTLTPIAGARVRSRGGGELEFESCSGGRDSYGEAVTDGQGRFRLAALPLEWIVTLWAEMRGYGRGELCVKLHGEGPAPDAVELRLPSGGWLTATVRDASGAAVAGATVRVVSEELGDVFVVDEVPDPFDNAAWSGSATTDADGNATVLGLPLDARLRARAQASKAADSAASTGLVATARDPALHVDLRLRAGATLVVRLQDLAGKAVSAVGVHVDGRAAAEAPDAGDSPDVARFEGLAPGRHEVLAYARGFRRQDAEVELPEGAREERVFKMDPGAPIAGHVVDDRGNPIAATGVHAVAKNPDEMIAATTELDGTFELRAVAGRTYVLRTSGGTRDHGPSAEAEVHAPARDVRLVCPRLARVTARLRAPEGHPLPGEVLVYVAEDDNGWSGANHALEDGRLSFPYPDGNTKFRIDVDGFVHVERDLAAAPGAETDLGEILLDPGIAVEGRVVDGAGAAVAGAEIEGPIRNGTRTDAEGRFRIEHLPRADLWLYVRSPDHLTAQTEIPVAELAAPIRIVLQRGGVLVGRVLLPDGTSAGKRFLTVQPTAGGRDGWVQSDLEGAFRHRLQPGAYRVAVGGPGAEPTTWVDATIVEGRETSITVRTPP